MYWKVTFPLKTVMLLMKVLVPNWDLIIPACYHSPCEIFSVMIGLDDNKYYFSFPFRSALPHEYLLALYLLYRITVVENMCSTLPHEYKVYLLALYLLNRITVVENMCSTLPHEYPLA